MLCILMLVNFVPTLRSIVADTLDSNTKSENKTSIIQPFDLPIKTVSGRPNIATYLEADTVIFNNEFTGTNGDELHMGGQYNDKINILTTFKPTSTLPPYQLTAQTVAGVPGIWVPNGFDMFLPIYMQTNNWNQTDFIDVEHTTFKIIANGVDISSDFSMIFQKTGLSSQVGLYFTYTPPTGTDGMLAIGSGLEVEISVDEPDIYPNGGIINDGRQDYFTLGIVGGNGLNLNTNNGGSIMPSVFGASPAGLTSLKFFFGYAPTILGVEDMVVQLHSVFDPMDGVTADDKHDGDLTKEVTYSGEVNTDKVGVYPVKYSVTDSDNNTTTVVRNITVEGLNPIAGGDITVKYTDEFGKVIEDEETLHGNVGDKYESVQKDIDGYTFKEVIDNNAKGEFTDQPQTVTYVYKQRAGEVTVKYVNTQGKEIAKSEVFVGFVGHDYDTIQKNIDGYKFKKIEGADPSGKFTDQPQTVIYVYTTDTLRFYSVPEELGFNQTKIGSRTQTIERKDPDWKIIVEDTRLKKNNWRVTAKLAEKFTDSSGQPLQNDILLFRRGPQSNQWITSDNEINVFSGTSAEEDELYDVSWKANEGPLIQVAPGTVKIGKYTGVINWNLIDAPV